MIQKGAKKSNRSENSEDNLSEYILINKKGITLLMPFLPLDYYYQQKTDNISIEKYFFDVNDIKYYKILGSERTEQIISGGGGGGSSITGAIIGGAIAGNTGAIIGSRKKVDEIKTTYNHIDDRKIEITLNDEKNVLIDFKFYELLLENMPQKDYDVYIDNLKSKGKNK